MSKGNKNISRNRSPSDGESDDVASDYSEPEEDGPSVKYSQQAASSDTRNSMENGVVVIDDDTSTSE